MESCWDMDICYRNFDLTFIDIHLLHCCCSGSIRGSYDGSIRAILAGFGAKQYSLSWSISPHPPWNLHAISGFGSTQTLQRTKQSPCPADDFWGLDHQRLREFSKSRRLGDRPQASSTSQRKNTNRHSIAVPANSFYYWQFAWDWRVPCGGY